MLDPAIKKRVEERIKNGERPVIGDPDWIAYTREAEKEAENQEKANNCKTCVGKRKVTWTCHECNGTGEVEEDCECQN